MKREKRKLIPVMITAIALLAGSCCLFAGIRHISADDMKASYLESVRACMAEGENPLSDQDVEQAVRMRLSHFELTEAEADAVIKTLNNPQTDPRSRDLYLLSVFDYECSTKENHATSYYSAQDRRVHIGKNVAPNNFIATFFHESGHAIQIGLWQESETDGDKADSFRFPCEIRAYDALVDDVGMMIESCMDAIEGTEYTAQQKRAVVDAFTDGSSETVGFEGHDDDSAETQLLLDACDYVSRTLSASIMQIPNSNASMVSDVYGGVTNNRIIGGMGHPAQKTGADGMIFYYWYDEQCNTTYNQLTEAWAEYFSASVTGDTVNAGFNEEYFPSACPVFEELETSLLEYYYG